MQEELRTTYNIPPAELLETIGERIKRGGHEVAEVECLAFRAGGVLTNGIMLVRVGCSFSRPESCLDYEHTMLIRHRMPTRDLTRWLSDGPVSVELAGVDVRLQNRSELNSWAPLCGASELSQHPGDLFRSASAEYGHPDHAPLIHSGAPYYPNQDEAVRHWIACESFNNSGLRWGELAVFVADRRARLASLHYVDGVLTVDVEQRDDYRQQLQLKAGHRCGDRWTPHEATVVDGKATLTVPSEIDQIDLYLVGSGSEIIDRHVEHLRASIGIPGAVIRSRSSLGAESLREVIDRGEGETTEFKKYVDPKPAKADEIVKAVIAFANSRGGKIIIGVNDECQVVGIDPPLEVATRKRNEPIERDRQRYLAAWQQKISHCVSPDPKARLSIERLDGRTLLVMDVPPGKDRPYIEPTKRTSYVRRGANSVPPDPRSDWAELLKNPFRTTRIHPI